MEMVGDGGQIPVMQGGEVKHVFAIMDDPPPILTQKFHEMSDVFFSLKILVGLFGDGDCHTSLVQGHNPFNLESPSATGVQSCLFSVCIKGAFAWIYPIVVVRCKTNVSMLCNAWTFLYMYNTCIYES